MKHLLVVALAVGLVGCDPEAKPYQWVTRGTLSGMSCKLVQSIRVAPSEVNCLAVVKSAAVDKTLERDKTQSYKVDKNYNDLLGKRVDVTRVGDDSFRLTSVTEEQ